MIGRSLLLFALVLTGCAGGADSIQYSDRTDFLGNVYPVDCLGNVGHGLNVYIEYVSEETLQVIAHHPRGFVYGTFVEEFGRGRDGEIYIEDSLSPEREMETLRHEMCHARMLKDYGDARWHR